MTEIILPNQKGEQDIEVISVGVCKVKLHDEYLEFIRQSEVSRLCKSTGLEKIITFDEYGQIKRKSITYISYNYSDDGDCYLLEVYANEFTIAVSYPVDKKEEGYAVSKQIFNWSL